ncbi:MAG: hypothetical protein PHW72_01850 [Candidatus Pacebacteria bacterium]|nr:hypothetical protein [Candidatus Paceibacterota bacterium]
MEKKLILITFGALIIVFAAIMLVFNIPSFGTYIMSPSFFIMAGGSLLILGIILIFLTAREVSLGQAKNFLLITGFSAAGIFLSVILHNFIYGLIFAGLLKIPRIDESFFFILATIIFPISFLIGAIGSVVNLVKK